LSIPPSPADGPKASARSRAARVRSRLRWWWHAPIGLLVIGIVIILITTIAFGATRPDTGNPPAPTSQSPRAEVPTLHSPLASPPALSAAPALPELDEEIARIEEKYDVLLGITLNQATNPYTRQQETWYGGTLRGGEAFETIDVPIALAVLNEPNQPQQLDYMFTRALADNSQAGDEALWAYLGTADEAASKTTQALRAYGDFHTTVDASSEQEQTPPYDTTWSLEDQSLLMGVLTCKYADTYKALSKLNDQSDDPWGLQTLPLTYSRGAWGQTANGDLLVRQFGLIRLSDGTQVGIAMAASSTSDDSSAGQAAITELANSVRRLATGFDSPQC